MKPHVKTLRDLPKLFTTKGDDDMPKMFKKTPARLDALVQNIWHFQQLHQGATPTGTLLEHGVDLPAGSFTYYRNLLEMDERIALISHRPLRVTLKLSHPKNKAAIARKLRELEKLDQAPRQIAPELPFEGSPEPDTALVTAAYAVVNTLGSQAPDVDNATVAAASTYAEATDVLADAKVRVRQMLPRLLTMAEARDLIHELVERGYVVSKGR